MRCAGSCATASALAQCRSMRSGSVSMPCRICHALIGDERRAVDAQRLHARPHREAEVAEGLVELARRGSPSTARSCPGTCRCPTGSGRFRPARRRASCRGRRGTWSPSGRRCRRRSAIGLQRNGDGTVLSTTSGTPCACATSATAAMSSTVQARVAEALGEDGAASMAASPRRRRRPMAAVDEGRLDAELGEVDGEHADRCRRRARRRRRRGRPAASSVISAIASAAMPLADASAARPPSSAATRSSSAATVGFDSRE